MSDNEKDSFWLNYIVTFFWLIFMLSSLIPLLFEINEQKHYEEEMAKKYTKTIAVYDHAEDSPDVGKILVYKYDVDGEKYTYKSKEPTNEIPKEGTEYEYYYEKDKPYELVEKENTKSFKDGIIVVAFFSVCLILSIIGAIKGGVPLSMSLSFVPLMILFLCIGIAIIIVPVIHILEVKFWILLTLPIGIAFTALIALADKKLISDIIIEFKELKKE